MLNSVQRTEEEARSTSISPDLIDLSCITSPSDRNSELASPRSVFGSSPSQDNGQQPALSHSLKEVSIRATCIPLHAGLMRTISCRDHGNPKP